MAPVVSVIDTHVHFWDVGTLRYPWIAPGSLFDRTFSPQDYLRTTAAAHADISGMVFIEADAASPCTLQEARWVQELAAGEPRIRAIVARVSLATISDIASDLDTLVTMPFVKGIRDNIQGHGQGFALQPPFVAGVREIGRRDLHFELCLEHQQLGETLQLVRLCPDVRFVLDHCAKPDIRNAAREPWLTGIRQLAALPNVVCKVSGLATQADPERWQPDDLLWYARQAADAFGPTRILFGSDWPVCEAAGGVAKWFSVVAMLTDRWSAGERESFFCGNAARTYRLR